MKSRSPRLRLAWRTAAVSALAFVACNSAPSGTNDPSSPSIGPEGGLIDFDAAAIPLPSPGEPAPTDAAVDAQDDAASFEGGPTPIGPAPPTCVGVPTACASALSCASVLGCTTKGACGGVSESCFSVFSDFACISLEGCTWSGTDCSGDSWPCDLFNASTSCFAQTGCNWTTSCGGTPTPCDLIPAASCATQPGCSLE